MKRFSQYLVMICLALLQLPVSAQTAIPAAGGIGNGTGGTISFSLGQVAYSSQTGSNGSIVQGVQQPYEISLISAVKNTEYINLECNVYPNPTSGSVKLNIKSFDYKYFRFCLYDITGVLLMDQKIESEETTIIIETLPSSVYFLKVIYKGSEVKVFKIIKK